MSALARHQYQRELTYADFTGDPDREFRVARRSDPSVVAVFRFNDNRWSLLDTLKPSEKDGRATVGFGSLPPFAVPDVKQFIAHIWLETDASLRSIRGAMEAVRDLFRHLPDFAGPCSNLREQHAKAFRRSWITRGYSHDHSRHTRAHLNEFGRFMRRIHPTMGAPAFIIPSLSPTQGSGNPAPMEQDPSVKIETEILAKIIDACSEDLRLYREEYERRFADPEAYEKNRRRARYEQSYASRKRNAALRKAGLPVPGKGSKRGHMRTPSMQELHARAVMAQLTRLAICVGRRATAVCESPLALRVERGEWINNAGQKEMGVWIRFKEWKIKHAPEDVFCPESFGEVALDAIATVKELTATIRNTAPRALRDKLFLVPVDRGPHRGVTIPNPQYINRYLNGSDDYRATSLRARYAIPVDVITTHNFRHTRLTNLYLGGASVHEVAQDAGHAHPDMTLRHYIVGNEEQKRRFTQAIETGALGGALLDMMNGREIVETRLGKRHVEIMRRRGLVLTPNRYGYCGLPSASGPCPNATKCYVGPTGEDGGCDYHLLSPEAIPALHEDREVIEFNIAQYASDPDYRVWVEKQQMALSLVVAKIDEANVLQARLASIGGCGNGCMCSSPCGCGPTSN